VASVGLVGLQEESVVIDGAGPLATIGIELHPSAAYRFFPLRLADLANGVYLAQDVVDRFDPHLPDRLASAPTLSRRVAVIEDLLLRLLRLGREPSPLVDWAVSEIKLRHGALRVDELCKRLGYSRRYVDQRFAEQVGVGPKTLAAIFRFQRAAGGSRAIRGRG
jgi:AraC-like DNA-binding protein